eukprot:Ihof_evm1s421 gene=Ihof_evmTU1s421
MLDCGMHMGYNDERRFPDFSYIAQGGNVTQYLDAVIITHFHLDHCGALPYFTEMIGYDGPIYMTQPTKAICPILLEDYRHIQTNRHGEKDFFTSEMIKNCMKKVVTVALHQTIKIDDDLEIKAYYAGHVLGAAMFYVKAGMESIVYTGDYNMTPDRHLGAAWIDKCRPDLLITESTYATTIRDSKRCRERDFLKKVYDCVTNGGNVLIPVFALGRAQELCILLEIFWDRMNLKVPIYYSAGLTAKANDYYKLFINWTSQKIKKTCIQRNMFDFKHITPWDRGLINSPGPMVVFATPGMLHSGMSLELFAKWAPSEKNMLIMPGYCVAGTVGAKVLAGEKKVEVDGRMVDVKISVQHLSFSAHADAKGIMQLIRHCEPKAVMLVHGEASKMSFLSEKISRQFGISCYYPANGHTLTIAKDLPVPLEISSSLLKDHFELHSQLASPPEKRIRTEENFGGEKYTKSGITIKGVLVVKKDKPLQLMSCADAIKALELPEHHLRLTNRMALLSSWEDQQIDMQERVIASVVEIIRSNCPPSLLNLVKVIGGIVSLRSLSVSCTSSHLVVDWAFE